MKEKEGEGHQGTCIKDPWAKPKGDVGMDGAGGAVFGGKWRQLYLNNNKKRVKLIIHFKDTLNRNI